MSEPGADDLTAADVAVLQRVIDELTHALELTDLPGYDGLRAALMRAKAAAEAQLGDAPSAEMH